MLATRCVILANLVSKITILIGNVGGVMRACNKRGGYSSFFGSSFLGSSFLYIVSPDFGRLKSASNSALFTM